MKHKPEAIQDNNLRYKLCTLLAALSYSMLFFCISVTAVFACRFIYYLDIDYLNTTEQANMSREMLIDNYNTLIDYNFSFSDEPLIFPDFQQSVQGQTHFSEVRDLFHVFLVGLPVFLLISLFLTLCLRKKKPWKFLKYASVISILIPLSAGIFMAVDFDRAFAFFHQIAFDNDYWLFDPAADPVILALPEEFFLHCALGIIMILLLLCLISYLAYRASRKR